MTVYEPVDEHAIVRASQQSRFAERVVRNWINAPVRGRITIHLPGGRSFSLGNPLTGPDAVLQLKSYRTLWRSLAGASIGFAESYMAGDVDTPDPEALIRFFIQNREILKRSARARLFRIRRTDHHWHLRRRNTRQGSRRNIADHYDLGNSFYAHWLDDSMTYSSGLFEKPDETLESAQTRKYQLICNMARLSPGQKVLEIGCGWGGFARHAALMHKVRSRGISLSRRQLEHARQVSRQAGLEQMCEFAFEDYRDTSGTYDRIVSIEMIEAVGEEHWTTYFRTLHDRLKPGGSAVIQAITIAEDQFETYRGKVDFIQRYIFPGGMLPTRTILHDEARRAGLVPVEQEDFGPSYARTLSLWRQRFEHSWPEIASLGFDERFRRMWRYYLAYCEAGFSEGALSVGLFHFVKQPGRT